MPKSRTTKPAPSRPRSLEEIADQLSAPFLDPREAYLETLGVPIKDFKALEDAVRALRGDEERPDLEALMPGTFPNHEAMRAFEDARAGEIETAREFGFWIGLAIGRRLAGVRSNGKSLTSEAHPTRHVGEDASVAWAVGRIYTPHGGHRGRPVIRPRRRRS